VRDFVKAKSVYAQRQADYEKAKDVSLQDVVAETRVHITDYVLIKSDGSADRKKELEGESYKKVCWQPRTTFFYKFMICFLHFSFALISKWNTNSDNI